MPDSDSTAVDAVQHAARRLCNVSVQTKLQAHATSRRQRVMLSSEGNRGVAETLHEMLVAVWALRGCRRVRLCSRRCYRRALSVRGAWRGSKRCRSGAVIPPLSASRQNCRRYANARLADFALRDLCSLAWAVRISSEVQIEWICRICTCFMHSAAQVARSPIRQLPLLRSISSEAVCPQFFWGTCVDMQVLAKRQSVEPIDFVNIMF